MATKSPKDKIFTKGSGEVATTKQFLIKSIIAASQNAGFHMEKINFTVEPASNIQYGDYASNIAMVLAAIGKKSPHAVAENIITGLETNKRFNAVVKSVKVAGPGFINFSLSPEYLAKQIKNILSAKNNYGRIDIGHKQNVQVEFISANPTGPPTLGNGRGGFLGDALSNVLDFAGYKITREYYVNDAGEQIKKLGWSVIAAGKVSGGDYKIPYPPEELYPGGYVQELAYKLQISKFKPEELNPEAISRTASKMILEYIKRITKKLKIRFDVWFSEKSLHRQGLIKEAYEALQKKHLIEKKEGAQWLRLKENDNINERVLIKSNGEPTYLLPDIAYHWDKFKRRRFDKVIDIVGADHHAHMFTLNRVFASLGLVSSSRKFDFILVQLVRLMENGQEVRMSKRTGTFITLEELVDTVGLDAARFFFLMREPNSHMDFDMTLAREQSDKNPVYYVQYAHARCASILAKASSAGSGQAKQEGIVEGSARNNLLLKLAHPSETQLIKKLIILPELVEDIASKYEVSRLPVYATDVATVFSAFYRDCQVIGEDKDLTLARLALVRATKIVLANTMRLMGIHAPERM